MDGYKVMELLSTQLKEQFNEKINLLMAHIQTSVESDTLEKHAAALQTKLDALAKQYQGNEQLGTARYKLYEAQATLYYFQQYDDKARQFMEEAVGVRGHSFDAADRMLSELSGKDEVGQVVATPTLVKKAKSGRKAIGGWLFLFLLGLVIGICINAYTAVQDYNLLQDQSLSQLVPSFRALAWFEIIGNVSAVVLAVCIIRFCILNRTIAKPLVIAFLIALAIFPIIDRAWALSVFANYPSSISSINSDSSIGRNLIYLGIWLPYFMVSKRVKQTLTEAS